jgi:DNA-binding SARP family transcriptional activator
MEFGVLGPLEVRDDGRTVPVGRGKQRALLALLLLHAN